MVSSSDCPPVALTVAGSDSGGGAGIQADLKAMASVGVHGCSVITALTAQNTRGVKGVHPIPAEFIVRQIEAVTEDFEVNATKTGMLFNESIIEAVIDQRPQLGRLVVDPVMVAESGDPLLEAEAETILAKKLLPLSDVVTPNAPEARRLADTLGVKEVDDPLTLGRNLAGALEGPVVLLKGGHLEDTRAVDRLISKEGDVEEFSSPRLETNNTHGSGCAFSSLITAKLAGETDLREAVRLSKKELTRALRTGYAPGEGAGTLNFLD